MKQRISTIITFLLLAVSAMPQQMTVKQFSQVPQFIPSQDQKRDWDDELCGLVKIQGAEVDSVSGAFEFLKHSAEGWAYMTKGDRRITLYKKGYEPLVIDFSSYGIDAIQSNKVYLLTIFVPVIKTKKWFVGLHGGLNISSASLGVGYDGAESMTAFNAGGSINYRMTEWIGFQTGLYFSVKGYKYSDVNIVNEDCQAQFLDVPVQASVLLPLARAVSLQLLAGPYVGINVGGSVGADFPWRDDKFSDVFSILDYGGQVGIGFIFAKHINIGANYQYGLGDYKNRNLNFSLGYIF